MTGGFGSLFGWGNRNTSTRDQVRADLNFYIGSHEIKLGGDYQDAKTNAVDAFSGGQRVDR